MWEWAIDFFWAEKCEHVVSVENNRFWHSKIRKDMPGNVKLLLRDNKKSFIDALLEDGDKYDVIVLDGYAHRTDCAEIAITKLKEGWMIVLDDSDNVFYNKISKGLSSKGLIQIYFVGLKSFSSHILATSIFIKRDFDFPSKYPDVQPKVFVGEQRNYEA